MAGFIRFLTERFSFLAGVFDARHVREDFDRTDTVDFVAGGLPVAVEHVDDAAGGLDIAQGRMDLFVEFVLEDDLAVFRTDGEGLPRAIKGNLENLAKLGGFLDRSDFFQIQFECCAGAEIDREDQQQKSDGNGHHAIVEVQDHMDHERGRRTREVAYDQARIARQDAHQAGAHRHREKAREDQ